MRSTLAGPMRSRAPLRGVAAAALLQTVVLGVALTVAGPSPAQVVELNPVEISGTIRVGDLIVNSLTVRLSSTVGSSVRAVPVPPDAVEVTYSTIVQVPAGGFAVYFLNVDLNLRNADSSQSFSFRYDKPGGVVVQDGVPATLDLVLDPPSLLRTTVTALPGELLQRVTLFAERWGSGGFAFFITAKDAPPGGAETLTFDLPVGPDIELHCYGSATMTNGRGATLEPFQLVTVPDGGVGTCEFTPAEPPPLGGIHGTVDFFGDIPVDEYRIYASRRGGGGPPSQLLSPPFAGPGNLAEYEFTDLDEGTYDINALVTLRGGLDRVTLALHQGVGVSGGTVTQVAADHCQAAIDTSFVFGGVTPLEDWDFGDRPSTVTHVTTATATSSPLADPRDGPFGHVVRDGRYQQVLSFGIRRDPFEPGGFTNTNTTGSGFRFQPLIDVGCAETVTTPPRVLETGRVEVRFRVADGSYLQNPIVRAFCTHEDEQGGEIYRYEVIANSAAPSASVPVGIVPLEAPAGVCDLTATAQVGGVTVSFGSLNDLEIVPGVELVIGLGGPRIDITSPAPGATVDAQEILVTGTATDDGEVVSVVVNGVPADLVPSGNPSDPHEVLFSATVPLDSGANVISAVATDDDDNETEASLGIENAAAAPPDLEPAIEISSPAPGAIIDTEEVLVEGTASDDGEIVSVLVNGIPATLTPTGNPENPSEVAFAALVPLLAGDNTIAAVATDDGGNQSEASLDVVFEPPQATLPCDVDGDQVVDIDDIAAIFAARGSTASGPDDPRDSNGDGIISINDGRLCVLQCTNPGCAP